MYQKSDTAKHFDKLSCFIFLYVILTLGEEKNWKNYRKNQVASNLITTNIN